jgi:hypothetical protein
MQIGWYCRVSPELRNRFGNVTVKIECVLYTVCGPFLF